jgi:hypothetical protein
MAPPKLSRGNRFRVPDALQHCWQVLVHGVLAIDSSYNHSPITEHTLPDPKCHLDFGSLLTCT